MGMQGLPQDKSAVLYSSAGMLICLADEVKVDSTANAAILHGLRIDPRVDNQARAGLEAVGLPIFVARIENVQQSRRANLGIRGGRTRCVCRRRAIHGHATHGCGWVQVAPAVNDGVVGSLKD